MSDRIRVMRIILVSLLLLSGNTARLSGEVTVKQYKIDIANPKEAPLLRLYVQGLGEGMLAANVFATRDKTPLYCPPGKLALGVQNYLDIINDQIKSRAEQDQAQLPEFPI